MSNATVYAFVTATIQIAVRPSGAGETLEDLYRVSKQEAEGILRNNIPREHFQVIGEVKFSHAVVKENT